MKKQWALAGMVLLVSRVVFGQGSLTPPGAPAATMKTLDQVEPRTPISSFPYTITEPGSYYLTGNITAESWGLTVRASHVTVDLNGYSIVGYSGPGISAITLGAINQSPITGVTICNGTIRDCGARAIHTWSAVDCVLQNLRVTGNCYAGAYEALMLGSGFRVENCTVANNDGGGMYAEESGVFVNNTIISNAGTGLVLSGGENIVSGNIVKGNDQNYDFADGNQLDLLLSELPESLDWSCSAKLAGSLSSSGHGVVITASDVTLDLAGFTLSGDGDSGDYGVMVDGAIGSTLNNVHVRNGIVENFDCGIQIEYCYGGRFEQLEVTENSFAGIFVEGGSIQTIADCLVCENSVGIYFHAQSAVCDDNRVSNCTISGNSSHGIWLYCNTVGRCNGNVIADCAINRNASAGINVLSFAGQCNGNRFVDCSVVDNGTSGISLSGSSGQCNGNTISGCAISGNGSSGVSLLASSGQCKGNVISHCTIPENGDSGIRLFSADENRIEGNHVQGNEIGLLVGGEANYVDDNTVLGNVDNYSISAGNQLGLLLSEIPETISWPCSVKLSGMLTFTNSDVNGITVASDHVTIDLDGHALIGPGEGSGHGISQEDAYSDLSVLNGTISDWAGADKAGVYAQGANGRFEHLQLSGNYNGMDVGDGATVMECQAMSQSGSGLVVDDGALITDCSSRYNTAYGIWAVDECSIFDCTVTRNTAGGIRVYSDSQVTGCTVSRNGTGIHASHYYNFIDNNMVTRNSGIGIQVGGSYSTVTRNKVYGNTTNLTVTGTTRAGAHSSDPATAGPWDNLY